MVSIVIPYYNGEDFIEKTIDSCKRQSYTDIEIIVVDDKSPKPFPKKLLEKYPDISLICNETNCGFCKNANRGVKVANGEFVIVLDQDDMLPENHVENIMKSFDQSVVAAYCGYHLIDENDVDYKICKNNDERELKMLDMTAHSIHTCGLMMRRKAFLQVGGYPEHYGNYGEWELWIKLLNVGRIAFCTSSYGLYRRHKDNITNGFEQIDNYINIYRYHRHCKFLAISLSNLSCLKK